MKRSLLLGLVALMISYPFNQVYSGERSKVVNLVKCGAYAPSDDYLTTVF